VKGYASTKDYHQQRCKGLGRLSTVPGLVEREVAQLPDLASFYGLILWLVVIFASDAHEDHPPDLALGV